MSSSSRSPSSQLPTSVTRRPISISRTSRSDESHTQASTSSSFPASGLLSISSGSTDTPTLIVTATPAQPSNPTRSHHPHREHQNGTIHTPFVIFILVIASIASLILLVALIRFSYSYFRTPARDRVSLFISRHRLQREMEQRTREERRNRRWWRGSLLEPPPPPYLHPPKYEGDRNEVEEARPLNPSVSGPRAAWHVSQPSLSLSYTSSHRDLYLDPTMDAETPLSSGYAISGPATSGARAAHGHSHSRSDSGGYQGQIAPMQPSYHPSSQSVAEEDGWRVHSQPPDRPHEP